MKKLYNVKVNDTSKHSGRIDSEGFLFCEFTKKRLSYTRGEALKKSRLFDGKAIEGDELLAVPEYAIYVDGQAAPVAMIEDKPELLSALQLIRDTLVYHNCALAVTIVDSAIKRATAQ